MWRRYLSSSPIQGLQPDLLLLGLRLAVAASLFFGHGVGKLSSVTGDASAFPDPLGIGPKLSAIFSMATECGGAVLVALGLWTRLACALVIGTMGVVAVIVHRPDPWGATEPSVLFALLFGVLAYVGPGRFSVDHHVFGGGDSIGKRTH